MTVYICNPPAPGAMIEAVTCVWGQAHILPAPAFQLVWGLATCLRSQSFAHYRRQRCLSGILSVRPSQCQSNIHGSLIPRVFSLSEGWSGHRFRVLEVIGIAPSPVWGYTCWALLCGGHRSSVRPQLRKQNLPSRHSALSTSHHRSNPAGQDLCCQRSAHKPPTWQDQKCKKKHPRSIVKTNRAKCKAAAMFIPHSSPQSPTSDRSFLWNGDKRIFANGYFRPCGGYDPVLFYGTAKQKMPWWICEEWGVRRREQ